MNLLAATFLFLNVFTFVTGFLVNYLSSKLPKCLSQIFRYGRANMSNTKPWLVSSFEVPKRWFWHFYLYAVLVHLTVLFTVALAYNFDNGDSWLFNLLKHVGRRELIVNATSTLIATSMFFLHLCRRLYETLLVSKYSNTTMNFSHYLLGYIHYTGATLCLVAHSPLFSSSKSTGASRYDRISNKEIIGVVIFLAGNFIQNRAHVGLANLRKGKDKKENSRHQVPHGGLFEYVSCPNYFAEIIIYVGLAAVFSFQNASWNQCLYWVICNQITSGIMNHMWYKDTFKQYPKQRKAILPFLL